MPKKGKKETQDESTMVVKEEEISSPTIPTEADAATQKSEKDAAFFQSTIKNSGKTSNQTLQFPWKLHEMLRMAEEQGKEDVISWLPEGRGFRVHKKEEFCEDIMPIYFSSKKYKTFQRSLNLWGFESISKGPNRGACFHEYFVKGQPQLCHSMTRVKVKGKSSGGMNGAVPIINANMMMGAGNNAAMANLMRGGAGNNNNGGKNPTDAQQQQAQAAFAMAAAQNPQMAMMQAMSMGMFNPAAMGMGFGMNPMMFNAMRQQQAAAMAAMQNNMNGGNADGTNNNNNAPANNGAAAMAGVPPTPAEKAAVPEGSPTAEV